MLCNHNNDVCNIYYIYYTYPDCIVFSTLQFTYYQVYSITNTCHCCFLSVCHYAERETFKNVILLSYLIEYVLIL